MKHIMRLFLLGLFASLSLSLSAAQPIIAWEAWLYDEELGQIIEVDSNGLVIQQQFLPADAADVYPRSIAFSPSGNLSAYNLYASTGQRMLVYDTQTRTVPLNILIPGGASDAVFTSLEFDSSSHIFSTDETRIGFGYQINDTWALIVYEIGSGSQIASIDQSNPAFTSLGVGARFVPVVRAFDGNNLDFTLVVSQAGGAPEYPAYRWNISSGVITPNEAFKSMSSNFFPRTNETIMPLFDARLPNRNDEIMGPGPHFNALHVGLNATGNTAPVLASADMELLRPTYIQNGERVAIFEIPIGSGSRRWSVIDRAGTALGNLQMGDLLPEALLGVGDGLIYSARTADLSFVPGAAAVPNTTALVYIRSTDSISGNPGSIIFFGESGRFPRLMAVQDNIGITRPLPGEWSTLLDAGSASGAPGTLAIGSDARIFSTAGDRVNMRSLPSLGGSIIERLEAGTQVRLLEGPRSADGLQWWRVRSSRGLDGWVVEAVDGIQVLQPIGGSAGIAPAATAVGPAFGGALRVGQTAIVTTAGNRLNVRRDPNTSASILVILDTGTVVSVNSGPVEADGFLWWRITTERGLGWAAEGSGGIAFLEPYIAPPVITPTPTPDMPVLGEPPVMLAAPLQLSPPNGAVFNNFPRTTTLIWQPVAGAAQYRVEIQFCGDATATSCANLPERITSDTSLSFDFVGRQPGRWRVQAITPAGVEGMWSAWSLFTYTV